MIRTAAGLILVSLIVGGCGHDLEPDSVRTPAAGVTPPPAVSPEIAMTPSSTHSPARTSDPIGHKAPQATPMPGRPAVIPPFRWRVAAATGKGLGASWHPGCPVGPADLRAISLRYWGFDGAVHSGVLVLNRVVVRRARAVFATMYQRKFPLRSVIPVHRFAGASDHASMAADNTAAFNCPHAVSAGPPRWSSHAYGRAIDVNPVENPYLFGQRVLPPSGAGYRNRSTPDPGLIRKGDPIQATFSAAGFRWGGDFPDPDYQHFER